MPVIFTTSADNVKENNVKEPIETKGSATGRYFQGRGEKCGAGKRGGKSKCCDRRKKTSLFLFFLFLLPLLFASVKLGVTPGVGEVWLRPVVFT